MKDKPVGLARVAVIDSNWLTKECISNNISRRFRNLEVVSFSSVVDSTEAPDASFGLIILNLHMSEDEPLELIRILASTHRDATLFLISDIDYHTEPGFIQYAWRLGTRGFVSAKTTSLDLALSAIRFVQAGGSCAPIEALPYQSPPLRKPSHAHLSHRELTRRERVVLTLLEEGKSNEGIAQDLCLSRNTVKVHVHNIIMKMRVSNRVEAASKRLAAVAANNPDGLTR
jgi:DNA-binding NarL/FixJ family response regulator